MSNKQILSYFIIAVLFLGLGFLIGSGILKWNPFKFEEHQTVEADILLTELKQVSKWIQKEATFSELYHHKDFIGLDFWPFQKEAVIRIDAKASIGYDLEGVEIEVLYETKEIIVYNWPDAEVLALDTELWYYNMTEGIFNVFDKNDLNELQDKAKETMRNKIDSLAYRHVVNYKSERLDEYLKTLLPEDWKILYQERSEQLD